MSNESITYLVVAACGVFSLAAYVAFILVPAWTAYTRVWQRIGAAFEQALPKPRPVSRSIKGQVCHKRGLILILSIGKRDACKKVTEAERCRVKIGLNGMFCGLPCAASHSVFRRGA